MFKFLKNDNYKIVEKFNINENGIQIIEGDNEIEIYNDPFRTVPLFITKDKTTKKMFS